MSTDMDQQMEDDRLWFEDHPEREYRIRPFIEGELPSDVMDALRPLPSGYTRWTTLRQVVPGLRLKGFYSCWGQPADGEKAVARIHAMCATKEVLRFEQEIIRKMRP